MPPALSLVDAEMGGLSDNMRGAVLMVVSMAAFTFNDACMKAASADLPFYQAVFLRGAISVGLLALVAYLTGSLHLRMARGDGWVLMLRTLGEIGGAYFFLTAIFNAPLAAITAILQALPLVVTLAGALFFGETLGWRRLAAIGLGFVGVLLIVRPGTDAFNIYSVYALMAVLCIALRDLITRRLSGSISASTASLVTAAAVTAAAGAMALTEPWAPLEGHTLSLVGGAGLLLTVGYITAVMTMRVGEIGFTAPFRYTGLVWALILGLVMFGEWPAPLTLLGAAIVVGSGVYMLWRESRLLRAHRRVPPPPRLGPRS